MKRVLKRLGVLLLLIVTVANLEGNSVAAATKLTVKSIEKREDAKPVKIGKTYTVTGLKKDVETCVKFTLKEESKVKVKVSGVTKGTLSFRIRSQDKSILMYGFASQIYTQYDETSGEISTEKALPAGNYIVLFEARTNYSDVPGYAKSCTLKVTYID